MDQLAKTLKEEILFTLHRAVLNMADHIRTSHSCAECKSVFRDVWLAYRKLEDKAVLLDE